MKAVKLDTIDLVLYSLKRKRNELSKKKEENILDIDINVIEIKKHNFCIAILERLSKEAIEVEVTQNEQETKE